MKYKYLLIAILITFSFWNVVQGQNLQISGGNNFSVSLCSNGRIYAWGNNGAGQLGRNPVTGTKYAAAFSTVPLEVQLPAGLTMQKVDAGSGATGITLACDGSVWTWGENCNGAIGNGLVGSCGGGGGVDGNGYYSQLQRVRGGAQGGTWLTNILYINASTNSSFAVEAGTGKVLAWGDNSSGQLGQGTSTNAGNTYQPYYVKTAAGVDLTGMVMVEGNDYGAYALGADGYVYSWGGNTNQDLGRPIAGDQYYAQRVRVYNYTTGTTTGFLSNIVKITGGDTHGLAIDSNGDLWSWGGDWGPGQRGWGATGAAVPYATRVVAPGTACAYEQWKFGPWISGVREISAGQQHSIALMTDGRVVTFGNNGGGQLGTGNTTDNGCPVYVKTSAGVDLTNIVAISDGDLWSFAIASSGAVYVWGKNSTASYQGVLGINGNTTDQTYAYLNPAIPTTCGGSLLPCPIADLGADVLKCAGISQRLYAGANGDPYRYTWYYSSSAAGPWTMIGSANQTYAANGYYLDVTTPRFYKVEITDIRNPVSTACGPCPLSSDVVQVTDRTPPLATSQAGVCGGTQACFDISSTGAIDNTLFDWYASQASATKLNSSPSANPFCTPISGLTLNGSNYEIWVQDNRVFQSTVGPTVAPCTAPSGTTGGVNFDKYQQQMVVYRDITITSVDVYYRTYSTNATPDQVRVNVYTNNPNKNSSSNDGSNTAVVAFSSTASLPRTSTNFAKFTLSGLNLPLTGSPTGTKYWLEIAGVGGTNGQLYEFTCAGAYPYSDAIVSEDVVILRGSTASYQVIQQTNYNASAFNWNFTYQGGYPCGRFKLTAPSGTAACPLPVDFLYFQGKNQGAYNHLTWATGYEENSDYFEIMKSLDGIKWITVGKVKAAGFSKNQINYSFDDKSAANVEYYKIVEKDFDGNTTESKIITLNNNFVHDVSIRPNPNKGSFSIYSNFDITTIKIFDPLGKEIYFKETAISEEQYQYVNLENIDSGIYYVSIQGGDFLLTRKIIVD